MSSIITPTPTTSMALCTTAWLPANGILSLDGEGLQGILTLDNDALFQAPCPTSTGASSASITVDITSPQDSSLPWQGDDFGNPDYGDEDFGYSDFHDPFYASSFPVCYALAATTVTAYMLVIMLFITPRTFFDSGVEYLGRAGAFTNNSSGGVSIGGRPWLQKLAALTVAISLTIATADTFKTAKKQYIWGVQNAKVLQNEVMGSVELRAIRIVSDTFVWFSQAQTLIRLFPRHREKIMIKWAACALISLDVVFSALNSFLYNDPDNVGGSMPRSFAHPIPALCYLFQLSLGVLYAAWVIYYALMKKRYAFYHPFMKNMVLVAAISLISILIPVVFFILDISKPDFAGWGDYVRWVGAAAASVVVWEWVERIEALEREEKKGGILGREVFDGDDTLEVNASERPWARHRKSRKGGGNGGGIIGERQQEPTTGNVWPGVSVISNRHRDRGQGGQARETSQEQQERSMGSLLRPPVWLTRPAPSVTPASRTDTASAASTVYAVRYQGGSETTTRTPDPPVHLQSMVDLTRQDSIPQSHSTVDEPASPNQPPTSVSRNGHIVIQEPVRSTDLEANITEPNEGGWRTLTSRDGESPSDRQASDARSTAPLRKQGSTNRWNIRSRLEEFTVSQAERIRERIRPTTDTDSLPVTVIPAPPRRGAALQQVLEEEEEDLSSSAASAIRHARRSSTSSSFQELSEDMARHDRQDNAASTTLERTTPAANPPLWPGVNHRRFVYDDDDYSYDDSVTETSSVVSHGHDREPEPDTGPDDRRTTPRWPGNS